MQKFNVILIAIAIAMLTSGCLAFGPESSQAAAATPVATATAVPAAAARAASVVPATPTPGSSCTLGVFACATHTPVPTTATPVFTATPAVAVMYCPATGDAQTAAACKTFSDKLATATAPTPAPTQTPIPTVTPASAANPLANLAVPTSGVNVACPVLGNISVDMMVCAAATQKMQNTAGQSAPAAAPAAPAQPSGLTAAAQAVIPTVRQAPQPGAQAPAPLMPQPVGPGISFTDEHDSRCPTEAQGIADLISYGKGAWRYFGPNASHSFGKWIGSFSPALKQLVDIGPLFGSYDNHDFKGYVGPIFDADGVTFNCRVRR